ncbi:flavin reductase family protein [Planctomyces sp. SH-PL62]|uniref:flavin reductase family protein n=1 Tax=Planctomyces sp. SH-PL62 TaxID=1636152 RepID=UPI00078B4B41|nr:flavin reductase family protein [Planctomyces sp. SH-PL62]AMV37781.1 p-hydroxyphenylacetate 3-hydroxylase, reductase component [Planctomyces sp. SH-PL62]
MAIDALIQRKVMGRFATGVTVVTTGGSMGLHGLTANAVTSLSLDPPLILVAVDRRAHSLEFIKANRCFAVNILRVDQEEISRRFARPGPKDFLGLDLTTDATDAPIIAGGLAYLDCRLYDVLPGGDHEIFVGEVVGGSVQEEEGDPLLYFAGGYRRLAD